MDAKLGAKPSLGAVGLAGCWVGFAEGPMPADPWLEFPATDYELAMIEQMPEGSVGVLLARRLAAEIRRLRPPAWTKEPPTVPGLYWWRHPDWPTCPWYVTATGTAVAADRQLYSYILRTAEMGGEWKGPLSPE